VEHRRGAKEVQALRLRREQSEENIRREGGKSRPVFVSCIARPVTVPPTHPGKQVRIGALEGCCVCCWPSVLFLVLSFSVVHLCCRELCDRIPRLQSAPVEAEQHKAHNE